MKDYLKIFGIAIIILATGVMVYFMMGGRICT
jgi:hypothetical protein